MKYSLIAALVLTIVINVHAVERSYSDIQCVVIESTIEKMNEQLPSDRQLTVNCSESAELFLWGLGKKNVKANVKLRASIPLCSDSEHVYTHKHRFNRGIYVSQSKHLRDKMIEIFNDFGIIARPTLLALVGNSTRLESAKTIGYIQFPYCTE